MPKLMKKILSITLALLLIFQSNGFIFAQKLDLSSEKKADNFGINSFMSKNSENADKLDRWLDSQSYISGAEEIVKLMSGSGYNFDAIRAIADRDADKYLEAIRKGPKSAEWEIIYKSVVPYVLGEYILSDIEKHVELQKEYYKAYKAGISGSGDIESSGIALLVLAGSSYDKVIKGEDVVGVLKNSKYSEGERLIYLQYAGSYMAHRWGRYYFDDAIEYLRLRTWDSREHITKAEFDLFAFYRAFDGIWRWGKTICSNKDGVWAGIKNCRSSVDKEYVEVKAPKQVSEMLDGSIVTKFYVGNLKEVNEGELLGGLYRMYGSLFNNEYEWLETYKSLYNRISFKKTSEAHRVAALGELAAKNGDAEVQGYTKGLINNQYFDIKNAEELGSEAGVLDDLGSIYAKLSGKSGSKVIKLYNAGGFPYEIKTSGNIDDIEGFWSSLVNFSERPSQSLLNIWIAGALVKGAVKGIPAAVRAISNVNVGNAVRNIPAIVQRSKRQYEALQYLARKNNMNILKYSRANNAYRSAGKAASQGGMELVEGVKTGEYFRSGHYVKGVHGSDIGRISGDVKQAASLGLRGTNAGGRVPSYITEERYMSGMSGYAADYGKAQSGSKEIVQRSFFDKVEKVKGSAVESLEKAPYEISRSAMYKGGSESGYLSLAQNKEAVGLYERYNEAYQAIRGMGYDFINSLTGRSFGNILNFHPMGWLKQEGLIIGKLPQTERLVTPNLARINNFNPFANSGKILSLNPSVSYANAREAIAVSGMKSEFGTSQKPFMPAEGYQVFRPERATFKVTPMAVGGGFGSGYYIQKNNLDLPLVFTASHVVGDANFVQIRDAEGFFTSGRVININRVEGYDLAAILVDENPAFLKGRIPFKLGINKPAIGEILMSYSYPGADSYHSSILKMLNNNFVHGSNNFPTYMVTPGEILPGSSGGAVTLGDFSGTTVGTIMSIDDNTGNVILVPLSTMRDFFAETIKKLLFQPVMRNTYLKKLPGLSNYYSNLLAKYPNGRNLDFTRDNLKTRISDTKRLRVLPSEVVAAEDILNSSVFHVERGPHYGTATYFNYRGFNALLTSGHVLREGGTIKVTAPNGRTTEADIFAKSPAEGRDLAIIIPRDETFLSIYKPLELTYRAPKVGMPLFSGGYQKEFFNFKEHKLLYNKMFIEPGSTPDELNYKEGYYALSGATGPGHSGAPFIAADGRLYGISSRILPSRDLTLAIRYSVVKDFMRQTLTTKFMDPTFDFDSFTAKYPSLAINYANVISRYRDISGEVSRRAFMAHEEPQSPSMTITDEGVTPVSGHKTMPEGKKNFMHWFNTRVLRLSPRASINSLYDKGALPRVYYPLRHTGEEYNLSSLEPYQVQIKPSVEYPAFPFTNVKMYAHRGMALNEKELVNIMDNGLRKVDMPDQNLAILAPQVTPGTKLQAISFSPYSAVSANYATVGLNAEQGLPVMVDVTGIGPKTAQVNAHGMFTGLDLPPERIKRYSVLLNINGQNRWGEVLRSRTGGFIFKPYKDVNRVAGNTNAAAFQRSGNNIAGITGAGRIQTPLAASPEMKLEPEMLTSGVSADKAVEVNSSAKASETAIVSGDKLSVEVVKDNLKPYRLSVPKTTREYLHELEAAGNTDKAAELSELISETEKLSARINSALERRGYYETMEQWTTNSLNDTASKIIRALKGSFDITNPAIEDLQENLYTLVESLYPTNKGRLANKRFRYRDTSDFNLSKFVGKSDPFVKKEEYLAAVKSYFKPGDIIAVANDEAYILDYMDKLNEDGFFGEGVIIKKFDDSDNLLRAVGYQGLKPKAIITDVTLPGGGIFAVGVLRSAGLKDIPMFAISGFTETDSWCKELYSVGFDAYMHRVSARVDMMNALMTGESADLVEEQLGMMFYNYMERSGTLPQPPAPGVPEGVIMGMFGPRYN